MPAIPTVIGGHTVRDPPQLDAGVSLNMYPERSKRETEYQQRQARFQLSVHGYELFSDVTRWRDPDGTIHVQDSQARDRTPLRSAPVTALAGTRERAERLVVAFGRELRVWERPVNNRLLTPIEVSGQPTANPLAINRLRPAFGCAHANDSWYWIRDDGELYWNSLHATQRPDDQANGYRVRIEGFGQRTPLGMAMLPDESRMFLTCLEDRVIRVWERRTNTRPNVRSFRRQSLQDLDLSEDSALNSPESIWISGSTMTILDAVTGRVVEYGFNASGGTSGTVFWRRRTPVGIANPFSMQRLVGEQRRLEPASLGGIYADAGRVYVANRLTGGITRVNQRSGALDPASGTQRDFTLAAATLRDGQAADVYICGAVAADPNRWYISGSQYPDGNARIIEFRPPNILRVLGPTERPPMPDAEQIDPEPGKLIPLGDAGRHVAWLVDRRIHILDLADNRLILNTEGQVDSVDYTVPRLVAADASIGELKVSPVNGIRAADAETYGEIVAAARLRIPAVSATLMGSTVSRSYTDPERIESFFVGIREIIAVLDNGRAVAYQRNDLDELPQPLNVDKPRSDDEGNVYGVSTAIDQTAFYLRDRTRTSITRDARQTVPVGPRRTPAATSSPDDRDLQVRLFLEAPRNSAEFTSGSSAPIYFRIDRPGVPSVYAWTANTTANLVFLVQDAHTGQLRREIQVYQQGHVLTEVMTSRVGSMRTEDEQWILRRIGQRITVTQKPGSTTVFIPDVDASDAAIRAENLLFADLEFDSTGPDPDWIRGITFVPDDTAQNGGFLYVAIRQRSGAANRTVIRAFELRADGWVRASSRDIDVGPTTNNRTLSHDSQFIFDTSAELVSGQLTDGTTVRTTTVVPFRHGLTARLSKYAWSPEQRSISGAAAVSAIRKNLYAWTPTGMELRDLTDATEGFPYRLIETRTVGLIAPNSIALVADVLYWLGVTEGGGLRVWRVGHKGDGVVELVEGKAIEEMFDRIAADNAYMPALNDAIGWADDTGGHPTYVLHMRLAGVSVAYDADADRWHVRSSTDETAPNHLAWPWMPAGQGAQRVTHSTTWQGRLVCGGYDKGRRGLLGFYDPNGWTDIDGDLIWKRRQFAAGELERERLRFTKLRVDASYGVRGAGVSLDSLRPKFEVLSSNDGGETFPRSLGTRLFGPEGSGPPRPFYRIGYSRERVYRVDCNAPVPFALRGAYQEVAQ